MTKVRSELVEVSPLQHPRGPSFWIRGAWALVTAECWLRHQATRGTEDAGPAAPVAMRTRRPSGARALLER